jgi:hydrogenase-4 component B
MQAAQIGLAACALALGLFPGAVIGWIAGRLEGVPALAAAETSWGAALGPISGAFAPLLLAGLGLWIVLVARGAIGGGARPAQDEAWMGGVPAGPGAPPIHPLGFYSPIREGLRRLYPAPRWPRLALPRWVVPAVDLDRWFYGPAQSAGRQIVAGLRRLHTGVPNVYLAWQLVGAAALALLLVLLLR